MDDTRDEKPHGIKVRKYRKVKREHVPLGIGPFSTPQEICDTARINFLLEVVSSAPNVLQVLAEQVFPFAGTAEYEEKLANWAETFQLVKNGEPADWALREANKTVEKWKRTPSSLQRKEWGPLGLKSASWGVLSQDETTIHIPEIQWNPQLPPHTLRKFTASQLAKRPDLQFMQRHEFERNKLQEFRKTLGQELDRIDGLIADACERGVLRARPRLRSREGFVWAVRTQVLRHEVWDIAKDENCEPATIIKRAREVLELIELTPRSGSLDIYKTQNP